MPRTGDGSLMLMKIMKILCKRFMSERSVDACNHLEQSLPSDVKEGHFVVYALNEGEPKRFIIRLDCLTHPGFVNLLELAAEEFGLRQAGVLSVPCRSVDLQRILGNWRKGDRK